MKPDPYTINISAERIARLKERLSLTTFPNELDEAGWDYGAPLNDIKRLAERWGDGFDWNAQEAKLNDLPNYRTSISVDGFGDIDVHFVHQKSSVENAIPLLFVHGCKSTKLYDELASTPFYSRLMFHVLESNS